MAARFDLKKIGEATSIIVSVFTILAISGGVWGYFSSQHDARVAKTFEFYRSFHSDQLQRDWTLLISRWNAAADKVKPLEDAQKYDKLSDLIISLVNDDPGRNAMADILDFFDEFYSCVSHSLCDRNSGVALLTDRAGEFVSPYGAYISYLRKEYSDDTIGAGVYNVRQMKTTRSVF
jgi:hypothetical protein